jgi:hypothetical protein
VQGTHHGCRRAARIPDVRPVKSRYRAPETVLRQPAAVHSLRDKDLMVRASKNAIILRHPETLYRGEHTALAASTPSEPG